MAGQRQLLNSSPYDDIDQLEAMGLADDAWNEVDTTTIRNCWHKASILPDVDSLPRAQPSLPISSLIHATEPRTSNDPVMQAEQAVIDALDDLELTGALQVSNRMDITELLNPAAEMHYAFEASDEDIFRAVMDARELGAGGSNGEGNSDEVDDEPVELGPTRNEALQAVLLVRKYVKDLDHPFARKLESMLGLFGKQTRFLDSEMRNLKDTKLTSYFKPT